MQLNKYPSGDFQGEVPAGDKGLVCLWLAFKASALLQPPRDYRQIRGPRAEPWTPAFRFGEMRRSSKETRKEPGRQEENKERGALWKFREHVTPRKMLLETKEATGVSWPWSSARLPPRGTGFLEICHQRVGFKHERNLG